MDNKDLEKLTEHFFEKCPTEARNFFHQILDKLEKIEDKITTKLLASEPEYQESSKHQNTESTLPNR